MGYLLSSEAQSINGAGARSLKHKLHGPEEGGGGGKAARWSVWVYLKIFLAFSFSFSFSVDQIVV